MDPKEIPTAIDLAHNTLPSLTLETAEALHNEWAADLSDNLDKRFELIKRNLFAGNYQGIPVSILSAAYLWKLHEQLSELFAKSAQGWADVFFNDLRDKSQ